MIECYQFSCYFTAPQMMGQNMHLVLSKTPYKSFFEMIVKCYKNEYVGFQNVDSTRAVILLYMEVSIETSMYYKTVRQNGKLKV